MKKIFLLMLLSVVTLSCSDEIETNTPAIQGSVNDQFFRAQPAEASINADGSVKLTGTNDTRTITLQMSSTDEGRYVLGSNVSNQATFLTFDQKLYLAGAGIGDGMIEITENDKGRLSGTFYFNAISGAGDTLNFQKGFFFKIPITNADIDSVGKENSLKAEIGGVPFNALVVTPTESGGNLLVLGAKQNTSITLQFPTDIATGAHPLTTNGPQKATYAIGATVEFSDTGTLTIVSNDAATKTVKGTFEFTTDVSATEILNGSFQFTYQ